MYPELGLTLTLCLLLISGELHRCIAVGKDEVHNAIATARRASILIMDAANIVRNIGHRLGTGYVLNCDVSHA
jgi:hypothetical protein